MNQFKGEEKIDSRCRNCDYWWVEAKCPFYNNTTLNGECGSWKYKEGETKQFNDIGEEKNMDNAVEIVKKKSDLMNMLRNIFKIYDIEVDNGEISSLINEKKEEINHALIDRLVEVLEEIVKEYKKSKRLIENEEGTEGGGKNGEPGVSE